MSSRRRPKVRCNQVRPLLPELAEGALHEAGPVQAHVAGCPACSSELSRYRALAVAMDGLRDVELEPSAGFVDRVLAVVVADARRVRPLHRVTSVVGSHRVALSVGGAVVGATAVGLLWWRTARRAVSSSPDVAGSAFASP